MCIFVFWSRCCCCLSFFLLAALLQLVLVLRITSVLKQREVPATVSSFYVSVLYTTMLRRSIAAVVLGCFYFCPLDCDDSVMVDCVAVETGCMLEKFMKYFFSVSATTTFLCVYSIAVAAVEKGYAFLYFGRGAAAAHHYSPRLRCC